MKKPLLANLGFLLQICGLLSLAPIPLAFYFNETQSLISVLLAAICFLGIGFLLNAMCERKDLDFKSSCVFFVVAFTVMSIIGSIPFIYLDPFRSTSTLECFTNALFESVSGFTTTGFSLIASDVVLPKSFLLYRSLTELMGGVGIVFLLLVFFHSDDSLNSLGNAVGVETLGGSLRRSYAFVFLVYGVVIILFTVVFMILGAEGVVESVTLVIDTLTGGFSPSVEYIQTSISLPMRICLIIIMFLGSVNFSFNYKLITRRLREIPKEIKLYIVVIVSGTFLVMLMTNNGLFDSLFHVVSMASSTGFDYIDIPNMAEGVVAVFMLIMLLGGCGYSMAGGIKMFRVLDFFKSVRDSVIETVREEEYIPLEPKMMEEGRPKILSADVTIILFIGTLFVFSILFSTVGVSFSDALFEVGSALTTNGISTGITTVLLPAGYKYLLMMAMIIGRVEIITILVALYSQEADFENWLYRARKRIEEFIREAVNSTRESLSQIRSKRKETYDEEENSEQ